MENILGKHVEVKLREISRKWGSINVYDVYANGVRVAVVDGGITDCKTPKSFSISWDSDGDPVYHTSDGDYTIPFTMSEAVRELIAKGEEVKLFYVKEPDSGISMKVVAGPFLTWDEAASVSHGRWQKVVEAIYNVTRDGKLIKE